MLNSILVPELNVIYHSTVMSCQASKMNKKTVFGQFYTSSVVADIIAKLAIKHSEKCETAIELAAGEGELIHSLLKLKPNTKVTAIDIDQQNAVALRQRFSACQVHCDDSTRRLPFLVPDSYDIALGNPPFIASRSLSLFSSEILSEVLGLEFKNNQDIRLEYVFVCHYLKLLKRNGVLVVILPDTVVSGVHSINFRKALIEKYTLLEIIEIAPKSFESTEAKTHIIVLRKREPDNKNCRLSLVNENGDILKKIDIELAELHYRMDVSFHSKPNNKFSKKLGDFATISRGRLSNNILKESGMHYIHTTNFDSSFYRIESDLKTDEVYAEKGDILMCRVGTRVVGKSIIYLGPKTLISDCIFKISFKDVINRDSFYEYIGSEEGKVDLMSLTRGVCSRYLTKESLMKFEFP